jgi:ribosome-binding factor A
MPSQIRIKRISDRIRDELSTLLLTEAQDPRLSGISVTDVKVDRELAFADVYVSAVEGQERKKEVLDGLISAQGFLRRALADRVDLRAMPRLRFHWDITPERADHLEKLLATMKAEDEARDAAFPPRHDEDEDQPDSQEAAPRPAEASRAAEASRDAEEDDDE